LIDLATLRSLRRFSSDLIPVTMATLTARNQEDNPSDKLATPKQVSSPFACSAMPCASGCCRRSAISEPETLTERTSIKNAPASPLLQFRQMRAGLLFEGRLDLPRSE